MRTASPAKIGPRRPQVYFKCSGLFGDGQHTPVVVFKPATRSPFGVFQTPNSYSVSQIR
jgi:hypothetical protein